MLVGVLDHDDGGVHHRADGDGDAPQAHDVGIDSQGVHHHKGDQYAHRQHQDRHQGAAHMEQEQNADQSHHQALFDQGAGQVMDGAIDQIGTVVDRLDRHPLRQTAGDFGQLVLDVMNRVQRILAIVGDGDAADHLALAVEFGQSPPLVRSQFHPRHVPQQDRHPAFGLEHQLLQIGRTAQIALATHHILGLGQFHHPPAHIAVAGADHFAEPGQGNAVRLQLAGIHDHLILLDEAADAGHFGDTLGFGELIADEPVLQGAQFRQGALRPQHHILIDPADAGGVRPQRRRHPARQPAGGEVEVFQYPRARPVEIGAVLENHVNERGAEEGKAPHHLGLGDAEHSRTQGIGHLILDHLGRLARIVGIDDHLDIR